MLRLFKGRLVVLWIWMVLRIWMVLHGCWSFQRFLLVLQDLVGFRWTWLVFSGIRLFFRRTIIQFIHILVRAGDADVTGKRNYFYLVSLYWANLRSKKDILATLS